jgi:hypothetical protein
MAPPRIACDPKAEKESGLVQKSSFKIIDVTTQLVSVWWFVTITSANTRYKPAPKRVNAERQGKTKVVAL